jgi:hypothetical protein
MSEASNPTAGHEQRDVPARIPVLFIAFMAGFVPLCLLALWILMASVWEEVSYPPNPFAGEPVPANMPEVPQLQASPKADLDAFNKSVNEQLHGLGWVDREAGRVHIPIEWAMQLLAGGLPERGAHASQGINLEKPPVGKGVDASVEMKVNVSAAETVAEPGVVVDPGVGQEAGNE